MNKELNNILDFLHIMEGEKDTLRHSWTSRGRQESIAEHSWRVSLMAILLSPFLENKVNLEKVLKMIVIHDLAEIITGDIPAQIHQNNAKIKENREKEELKAIQNLIKSLGSEKSKELYKLWLEHEQKETNEAMFVKALDKIEVRIQHNEASLETWDEDELPRSLFAADKYCQFNKAIKEFNEIVKQESVQKLKNADINVNKLKKEAEILRKKQL